MIRGGMRLVMQSVPFLSNLGPCGSDGEAVEK